MSLQYTQEWDACKKEEQEFFIPRLCHGKPVLFEKEQLKQYLLQIDSAETSGDNMITIPYKSGLVAQLYKGDIYGDYYISITANDDKTYEFYAIGVISMIEVFPNRINIYI